MDALLYPIHLSPPALGWAILFHPPNGQCHADGWHGKLGDTMPTTLDNIAGWVQNDILKRTSDTDIQSVCRTAAKEAYKVICAKVPFDELMVTSAELPLVVGQAIYGFGSDFVLKPELRAIGNIRITFSSSNMRRLRRSHVRVYDSMSFVQNGRPATYARYGNTIELNVPSDSASYTLRFRYWARPPIGKGYTITAASWVGGTATLTMASTTGITSGDAVTLMGFSPSGYNGGRTATVLNGTTVTVPITTDPGTYIGGGYLFDIGVTEQDTYVLTPSEWDELLRYETLYKTYYALDQIEKAMALMQPQMVPRQPTIKKTSMFEMGIIPRLWNDLLTTVSQQENVDEDFGINPTMRAYSIR